MKLALGLAMGLLAVAGSTSPAAACEPPSVGANAKTVISKQYAVAFRTLPPTVAVGAPFALEISVCATSGTAPERLIVDAMMPDHRHGMNYTPTVAPQLNGRYRAEGLMFHMPGRWQFAFELHGGGRSDILTFDIDLK